MDDDDWETPTRIPPSDLVVAVRRLGSAILAQDDSIRSLLLLMEKGLEDDSKSHDRLERLLRSVEQSQYEIRECLRITQMDVDKVKENTGEHKLIPAPDNDMTVEIRGRAKIGDVFKSFGALLWRFKLIWAAGGGAALIKAIDAVLPLLKSGGH